MPNGLAALTEDPEAIRRALSPEPVTLPLAPEAMERLRQLQLHAVGGLEELLLAPEAGRDVIEQALFGRALEDINRESLRFSQEGRERFFGRGVGPSTITESFLADLERERLDAITRARREAILGAGAESRAEREARLGVAERAFGAGQSGLQAEAGVQFTQAGREQEARGAAVTSAFENLLSRLEREQRGALFREELGGRERLAEAERAQRGELAGQELESRERLQTQGFRSAEDIARQQLLAAGIAGGVGGFASIFGPQIRKVLA